MSLDPLVEKYTAWNPYTYVINNPIIYIDPNGKSVNGEYEKDKKSGDWVKVSTKGDKLGIDFYHEDIIDQNGNNIQITRVTDRNGNSNTIKDGRKWLEGEQRGDGIDWSILHGEFKQGVGPEKSIFEGDIPINRRIQESKWLKEEIKDFNNSNEQKLNKNFDWDSGIRATLRGHSPNMQLNFIGSYSASFYKLGSETLVLIIDSKTRESALGHIPGIKNYSRDEGAPVRFGYPPPMLPMRTKKKTTTYQTYFFFDPKDTYLNKDNVPVIPNNN